MVLSSNTPCQYFPIWAPRWSSQYAGFKEPVALLAVHKIGLHNEVEFTRTKSPRFSGHWYISGDDARSCPKDTNGTIDCYAVPFSKLQVLERRSEAHSVVDTPYPELSPELRSDFIGSNQMKLGI